MSLFRRTPRQPASPQQSPPSPATPLAAGQAPRSEAEELADLHSVMDVLLDDIVVAQRVPPNAPQPATPDQPALQPSPAPAAPPEPQRPAAPPPPTTTPGANPNVGPQLLPAPDGSWAPVAGAPPARTNGPSSAPGAGQRPPMPPAPVGVSTVPPAPAQPLPSVAPASLPPGNQVPYAAPAVVAAAIASAPATEAWAQQPPRAPHPPRTPGDPYALPQGLDPNAVAIRGRGEGVAIEMGAGPWDDLLDLLSWRLEQAGVSLRSSRIELELGNRALTETDLDGLRSVMAAYGMEPALVRSSAERTFMAALALGIATQQTTVDGLTVSEAQRGLSMESPLGYFIFRGSLRSGQQLHRSEHVLIIGDVNPGAEVVSAGDILVWGRLRGTAHAGARGNPHAVIAALDMDPVQLRIDKVIGAAQAGMGQSGPRWGGARATTRRPELARLVAGQLAVQEWDDTRGAGAVLKRRG